MVSRLGLSFCQCKGQISRSHVSENGQKTLTLPLNLNPFPNNKILDSSELKEFADDKFIQLGENGRKFFKRVETLWEKEKQVENTVGKREIASYEQFLLFLQCFQKPCTADT